MVFKNHEWKMQSSKNFSQLLENVNSGFGFDGIRKAVGQRRLPRVVAAVGGTRRINQRRLPKPVGRPFPKNQCGEGPGRDAGVTSDGGSVLFGVSLGPELFSRIIGFAIIKAAAPTPALSSRNEIGPVLSIRRPQSVWDADRQRGERCLEMV